MSRTRTLCLVLAGVLILLTGYLALILWPQASPEPTQALPELTKVDTASAHTITLQGPQLTLTLVKNEGFWYWDQDPVFPVDQDICRNMLGILSPLTPLRAVAADPANIGLYGLDEGATRVSVTDAGGTHSFTLGDKCIGRDGYYVSVEQDTTVYLCQAALGIAFLHDDLHDLIQLDPFPKMDSTKVTRLVLSRQEGELEIKKQSQNGQEGWLVKDGEEWLSAKPQAVESLLGQIGALSPTACVDYDLTEAEHQERFADGDRILVEYLHQNDQAAQYTLYLTEPAQGAPLANVSTSGQLCTVNENTLQEILAIKPGDLTAE